MFNFTRGFVCFLATEQPFSSIQSPSPLLLSQPSLSPSQQSPSPLSRTGTPNTRLQSSASLRYATNSHRPRLQLGARRNRRKLLSRITSEFVAIEQRRLEFQKAQDIRLHEREMERLRVESLYIEVTREKNQLLQQLNVIAQKLLDKLSQRGPTENPLR